MSGEPEDCDCGPDEPPDPDPNCGNQGNQGGAGCCTVFECVNLLEGSQGQNWVKIAQYPSVESCSTGDSSKCVSTNGELNDPANDAGTNYLVWSPDPCPCYSTAEFIDISSTSHPSGSNCATMYGWITWDPGAFGCQWYQYLSCPPGCQNPPLPTLSPEYQYGGRCCDPATGFSGCEEGAEAWCICPQGNAPATYVGPQSIKDQPCVEEDCQGFTATWIGIPYGEEVTKGLYRLQWDLIDDCPGVCCTEPPKEPELGNDTIFVTTPCKCNCQES